MSSPEKRTSKKKKEPSPNPSLPDDFLLSCFARISTLYYPSLSLVSKSFRSLLTSPELYKVRSLSDQTECCLYILNCRSNTWSEAPSMRDHLYSLSASVLDEKIYVVGRSRDYTKSLHVFDTETQTWDPLAIRLRDGFHNKTASIDGKFLVVASNKEVVIYDLKKVRWEVVRTRSRTDCNMDLSAYCEIDNVLYSAWGGRVQMVRHEGIYRKVEKVGRTSRAHS
ncbi:hypothetical protein F2Q70_00009767 [Brassica cretica]|uniref:F-box domain-containing protein n=1 Tax=Brassica cretica TaxID=69181 RepID=A0A8S9M2W1_BRACR|nr:hypothetical protein F2Q70_00009767 [Brassica cretica]